MTFAGDGFRDGLSSLVSLWRDLQTLGLRGLKERHFRWEDIINLVVARREAGIPVCKLDIDRTSLNWISRREFDQLREEIEVKEDDGWRRLGRKTQIDHDDLEISDNVNELLLGL